MYGENLRVRVSSADHTSCVAFLVVFPQPQLVLHAIGELGFAELPVMILIDVLCGIINE